MLHRVNKNQIKPKQPVANGSDVYNPGNSWFIFNRPINLLDVKYFELDIVDSVYTT
jgi:hypothetical protein